MTEFTNIKADCEKVAQALERLVSYLTRERTFWVDDPESEHLDADWTVNIGNREFDQMVEGLSNIRGLLWHLARNGEAVAHLVRQHMEAEGGQ